MKTFSFKLIIFTFYLSCSSFRISEAQVLTTKFQLKMHLNKTQKKDVIKELRKFISVSGETRAIGTNGHELAKNYLIKKVKDLSPSKDQLLYVESFKPDLNQAIKSYENDFKNAFPNQTATNAKDYKFWQNFTEQTINNIKKLEGIEGKNIIWEKKGNLSPEKIIILFAHYDSMNNDPKTKVMSPLSPMPGADDNGTGVSILLQMIQSIRFLDLPKTVRIIFFDYGEIGNLGSKAYVKKHKEELKNNKNIEGVINLEMLGHDTKRLDKTKKNFNMKIYTRKKSEKNSSKDIQFAERIIKYAENIGASSRFAIDTQGKNLSDSSSFWDLNLGVVQLSQDLENDLNPRFHTKNDFVETLNFTTFYKNYRFITGSLLAWCFDL
jgi:hypothetical protein